MKKWLAIILSLCMLLGTLSLTAYTVNLTPEITIEQFTEQLGEMNKEFKDEPVSNRLIVKSKHDIPILDGVDIVEGYNGLHIVQFDNSDSAHKALDYYKENNLIECVEADATVSTCEIDNTVHYDNHLSWGSESIGVDDYIDYLGDLEALPEVVVGIIDTGIDTDHEFLQDRIVPTGFNVSDTGASNSEEDDHGHGTHVAGIITDNTTPNVKIKSFKCLNQYGSGDTSGIITSIYAAIDEHVNVINMSLGGRGNSVAMEEAVNTAVSAGITVCVAAANHGSEVEYYMPANIDSCITVGAISINDTAPYWTNWGDGVDIVAPGVSILSSYLNNEYTTMSGTSMATPFVAAASAMLLSKDIHYNATDIMNILEENGRTWTTDEREYNFDKKALNIGKINDFSYRERTPTPQFNYASGRYTENIVLNITCEDKAEIYYTLDGTRATRDNGFLYTEPIFLDTVTTVHATAYSQNKLRSLQQVAEYYITSLDDESLYDINNDGTITAYRGNKKYLTLPDTINDITVTGIDTHDFADIGIIMIKCPSSLTAVYDDAFDGCSSLKSFDADNLEYVGNHAFDTCIFLDYFDFTNLSYIGEHAFDACGSITDIYNEGLTQINRDSFAAMDGVISAVFINVTDIKYEGLSMLGKASLIELPSVSKLDGCALAACDITELSLPNLEILDSDGGQFSGCKKLEKVDAPKLEGTLPRRAFSSSESLKTIYLPKITSVADSAFTGTSPEVLFLPRVTTISSLPNCSVQLYLSAACKQFVYSEYANTIIAPSGSDAEIWANENEYTFIDSDTIVDAIGTHTDENGNTVFEFGWNNIDDVEQYATEIIYGADDTTPTTTTGDITYFCVESNEPSVRGFVNIDGMVFRSAPLTVGENKLEPENGCNHDWQIIYSVSVPNDTIVVLRCDECASYYRVSFMEHINTDYPLLDLNGDGIVNAKDFAYIMKRA